MDIRFNNYRFNREQQLLYKDETLIELKTNQAALLELFLLNPDKIFSKDNIMDQVWKDKVVSEQVVFQNISQLRAIFGSDAIKTFSKKGYQWQITISPITPVEKLTIPSPEQIEPTKKKPPVWQIGLYLVVLSLLTYFYQGPEQAAKSEAIIVSLVDNKTSASQKLFSQVTNSALAQTNLFNIKQNQLADSVMQMFLTPKLVWQKANLAENQWLLWGDTYTSDQGIFLHYGLAKSQLNWRGYIFATNQNELTQAFAKRLKQLNRLGVLAHTGSAITIETLLEMHNLAPDDVDILLKLANHYIDINHLDVALTYLQRIPKNHQGFASSPYLAKTYWHIGKIYKMRNQHNQALASLDKMSMLLEHTNLTALQLENIQTHAWLARDIGDFDEMFKVLDQGLRFSEQQTDPLVKFELHILYSILAKKADKQALKYHHLNEAQALLLKYKLDDSNRAVVYFHFAYFSKDNDKAIPYLEKILTLKRTGQNYWIHDSAFEMVIDHYIEQKAFAKAHKLINQQARKPDNQIIQAKVYVAESKLDLAIPLFEKAYETARLEYNTYAGLQAALNLYQLSTNAEIKAEYLAYMESNASADWLKRHTNILASE